MHSLCKLARRSTGRSTGMFQSTSQSFLRSAQRGGRPCPLKRKENLKTWQKANKARHEREMKTYIPPKGETKKKFKDPNAPKRPPLAFFLFCSEYRPKSKANILACPLVVLQRNWERCGITLLRMTSSLVRRRPLS